MHSCLRLEEILFLICNLISRSQDLLHFALTCKEFQEPALQVLWRDLGPQSGNILEPLECLLPDDVRRLRPPRPKSRKRTVQASDWSTESCLRYLSYVRNAVVQVEELPKALIPTIKGALGPSFRFFFPNLLTLQYVHNSNTSFTFLKTLLAPSLTCLTFSFDTAYVTRTMLNVLCHLPTACPSIKVFSCGIRNDLLTENSPPLQDFKVVLSRMVLRWNTLQELTVPALTTEALEQLSLHTGLRTLRIRPIPIMGAAYPKIVSYGGFKSLAALELRNCTMVQVLDFLTPLQTSTLSTVVIDLANNDHSSAGRWKELFTLVTRCSSLATRLDLTVGSRKRLHPLTNEELVIDGEALHPLFKARNLERLELNPFPFFKLEDTLVEELAKSFPQLSYLDINTSYSLSSRPNLTPNAFGYILDHCPDVKHVGLLVDMSGVRDCWGDMRKKERNQRHGGVEISVGSSPPTDSPPVALFFALFFSELGVTFHTARDASRGLATDWAMIQGMTNVMIDLAKNDKSWDPESVLA